MLFLKIPLSVYLQKTEYYFLMNPRIINLSFQLEFPLFLHFIAKASEFSIRIKCEFLNAMFTGNKKQARFCKPNHVEIPLNERVSSQNPKITHIKKLVNCHLIVIFSTVQLTANCLATEQMTSATLVLNQHVYITSQFLLMRLAKQ